MQSDRLNGSALANLTQNDCLNGSALANQVTENDCLMMKNGSVLGTAQGRIVPPGFRVPTGRETSGV